MLLLSLVDAEGDSKESELGLATGISLGTANGRALDLGDGLELGTSDGISLGDALATLGLTDGTSLGDAFVLASPSKCRSLLQRSPPTFLMFFLLFICRPTSCRARLMTELSPNWKE